MLAISGDGKGLELVLATRSHLAERLLVPPSAPLVMGEGDRIPWRMLFPGDGLAVIHDSDGNVQRGQLLAEPGSGKILFASDEKITFADGRQFLVNRHAAIRLNVARVEQASLVPPGTMAAFRINRHEDEIGWLEGKSRDWKPEGGKLLSQVTHRPDRITREHNRLTITARGAPGATMTAAVAALIRDLPLQEVAPGRYEGSFTAPAGLYLPRAWIVVTAREQDNAARMIDPTPLLVATRGQVPGGMEWYPSDNAVLSVRRPFIYVTFPPDDVPLDVTTFRFVLDEVDVTAAAARSPTFLTFRPREDLSPGTHHASVAVRDAAGKWWRRRWRFTITGKRP